MIVVVDPHSGVPVYRQILEQVKFHVASGVLRPGDELPSTRQLAAKLGVNPMTVSKAYSLLEHDGVLERSPGRPLTVLAAPPDARQAGKRDHLRNNLQAAVTVARQLGIDRDEALQLFRELLDKEPPEEEVQ